MNSKKYLFSEKLVEMMNGLKISQVSICDICDQLDCSRQTFYYYFKDVEDCFAYYLRMSFQKSISYRYIISDTLHWFDQNKDLYIIAKQDMTSERIFWETIYNYIKEMLSKLFMYNIAEYINISEDKKTIIVSFYTSGILSVFRNKIEGTIAIDDETCIVICQRIVGSADNIRRLIKEVSK